MTLATLDFGTLARSAADPVARWLGLSAEHPAATAPVDDPIELFDETPAGAEARMMRQIEAARAAGAF